MNIFDLYTIKSLSEIYRKESLDRRGDEVFIILSLYVTDIIGAISKMCSSISVL